MEPEPRVRLLDDGVQLGPHGGGKRVIGLYRVQVDGQKHTQLLSHLALCPVNSLMDGYNVRIRPYFRMGAGDDPPRAVPVHHDIVQPVDPLVCQEAFGSGHGSAPA